MKQTILYMALALSLMANTGLITYMKLGTKCPEQVEEPTATKPATVEEKKDSIGQHNKIEGIRYNIEKKQYERLEWVTRDFFELGLKEGDEIDTYPKPEKKQ